MNEKKKGLFFGIIVILFGVSLLLNNFGMLPNADDFIGGMIFILLGVIFYQIMRNRTENWWAGIPAIFLTLFGLALVFKNFYFFPDDILGVIFMWCASAAFGYVFYKNNRHWWAIIPAGACITLGTVILVETMNLASDSDLGGVILFLGMGLTFLYLYFLDLEKRLNWAIYPAIGCFLMTAIVYIESVDWLRFDLVLPALLVIIGVFIIFRAGKQRT